VGFTKVFLKPNNQQPSVAAIPPCDNEALTQASQVTVSKRFAASPRDKVSWIPGMDGLEEISQEEIYHP
jgi:hypothetical protein